MKSQITELSDKLKHLDNSLVAVDTFVSQFAKLFDPKARERIITARNALSKVVTDLAESLTLITQLETILKEAEKK